MNRTTKNILIASGAGVTTSLLIVPAGLFFLGFGAAGVAAGSIAAAW